MMVGILNNKAILLAGIMFVGVIFIGNQLTGHNKNDEHMNNRNDLFKLSKPALPAADSSRISEEEYRALLNKDTKKI
jgi:hypothetical protein